MICCGDSWWSLLPDAGGFKLGWLGDLSRLSGTSRSGSLTPGNYLWPIQFLHHGSDTASSCYSYSWQTVLPCAKQLQGDEFHGVRVQHTLQCNRELLICTMNGFCDGKTSNVVSSPWQLSGPLHVVELGGLTDDKFDACAHESNWHSNRPRIIRRANQMLAI